VPTHDRHFSLMSGFHVRADPNALRIIATMTMRVSRRKTLLSRGIVLKTMGVAQDLQMITGLLGTDPQPRNGSGARMPSANSRSQSTLTASV
jgi:hypothetical protein